MDKGEIREEGLLQSINCIIWNPKEIPVLYMNVFLILTSNLLWIKQVGFSEGCIMSSCVKPKVQNATNPVVLLHCFDRFVMLGFVIFLGCISIVH